MKNDCLIIIPLYNEEKNLRLFLPELIQVTDQLNCDLIAINDASTDNSVQVLQEYNVSVITHVTQLGYGSTIQTGYKYALRFDYDYVIQIDGDGQHDPRFIPKILNELKNNQEDVIIGSRFIEYQDTDISPQSELYTGTRLRLIGIQMFRMLLRLFINTNITDPTSGYAGFNRRAIQFMSTHRFPFDFPDADLIFTLLRNHFVIKEIAVFMYKNNHTGYLHRGCQPIWYIFKVTLSLFVSTLRSKEA